MTGVLAVDPGFSEVRVGAFHEEGASGLIQRVLAAEEDPFSWFRSEYGHGPGVVVIAGGSYAPVSPGAYLLDARLSEDAARIDGWHPRNRMTVRAFEYCSQAKVPCIVLDPMSTACLTPKARLSGHPPYERRGVYYAVPQRQAYRTAVVSLGLDPHKAAVITVYLGDEASVTAHLGERILDTSDPVACEGPYGFTSAGTAPATSFISWLQEEGQTSEKTIDALKARSGALAYAGVSTTNELRDRLQNREERAIAGVLGMAYQVSKEVGREMAALMGEAGAIALTGPGACLPLLTGAIEERVSKWCPVITIEEDLALPALIREGLGALTAKNLLQYPGEKRY